MSQRAMETRRALGALHRKNLALWQIVERVRRAAESSLGTEGLDNVAEEILAKLEQLNPAFVFELRELSPQYPQDPIERFVIAVTQETQRALEAAMFVYAHAILDSTASELCQLLVQVEPSCWEDEIAEKKTAYKDVRLKPHEKLRGELLGVYAKQLARESLVRRIDHLHRHCGVPPRASRTDQHFTYDRDRVERIDQIRQEIMHRVALTIHSENLNVESEYARETTNHLLLLVQLHLGIPVSATEGIYAEALDTSRSRVPLATIAHEMLLGNIGIDQIVHRDGMLYLRDEHQQMMPLANDFDNRQTQLSHDRKHIAYIVQRWDGGARSLDDSRYDTGVKEELWVSDRDGSHARCLLSCGECPSLERGRLPEVFGNRIDGIGSPAWTHDDSCIYFLAPMWTTSAAVFRVYVDDGRVQFFTDGNWFHPIIEGESAGCLIVSKHKYWPIPEGYDFSGDDPRPFGSYDHAWLVDPNGVELKDLNAQENQFSANEANGANGIVAAKGPA